MINVNGVDSKMHFVFIGTTLNSVVARSFDPSPESSLWGRAGQTRPLFLKCMILVVGGLESYFYIKGAD